MAQVPPELLPYRFSDDGQRTPFPGGFVPGAPDVTAMIPGQAKVIKALMQALRARSRTGELARTGPKARLRSRPTDRVL